VWSAHPNAGTGSSSCREGAQRCPRNPDARPWSNSWLSAKPLILSAFPISPQRHQTPGCGRVRRRSSGRQCRRHFCLAGQGLYHSTAPNRRYPDLIYTAVLSRRGGRFPALRERQLAALASTVPKGRRSEKSGTAGHKIRRRHAAGNKNRESSRCHRHWPSEQRHVGPSSASAH